MSFSFSAPCSAPCPAPDGTHEARGLAMIAFVAALAIAGAATPVIMEVLS